ncbi:helix-turn-helix domain-containing protein [Enterococcus sp. LJL98]
MVSLKKLLLSAKAGDDNSFEEIVMKFQPLLINVSFRSDSFDEDCYQECLIALYKAIRKFEVR